ncbi:GSCFA domain-containing protein [Ideonella sp.]|uniref:GSCFA domain-containing protein n=1 Tax=Ideonella sp. TaxID=1929293 RepID=UPI0035AF29EA
MAIEVIPAEQAWATYRRNTLARWPTREQPDRLSPLAAPQARQVFGLTGSERVFCIGSCFAREIENALVALGFDVLSVMREFPRSPNRQRSDRGMLNKYNTATILNELRWAFGEGPAYRHEDVLVGLPGDTLLQDLQLSGPWYAEEPVHAHAFRDAFNAFFRRIAEADVVVLTLGLSEVWKDAATGLYLNHAPTEAMVAAWPGRFSLHVLDAQETLAQLEAIDALLGRHLRPGWRLLLTVSPVPLWSTFRDQDVLLANTYSKAVLRTCAEQFTVGRPHVSYFPSYEFVTLSEPALVWREDDFRHVDPRFVDLIMASVMAQYGLGGGAPAKLLADSRDRVLRRAPGAGQAVGWRARWQRWLYRLGRWRRDRRTAQAARLAARQVQGHVERWDGRWLTGWAFDPQSARPVPVQLWLDGELVAERPAADERADVAQAHGPAALHSGFRLDLDALLPASRRPGAELVVQAGPLRLKTLSLGEAPVGPLDARQAGA